MVVNMKASKKDYHKHATKGYKCDKVWTGQGQADPSWRI